MDPSRDRGHPSGLMATGKQALVAPGHAPSSTRPSAGGPEPYTKKAAAHGAGLLEAPLGRDVDAFNREPVGRHGHILSFQKRDWAAAVRRSAGRTGRRVRRAQEP